LCISAVHSTDRPHAAAPLANVCGRLMGREGRSLGGAPAGCSGEDKHWGNKDSDGVAHQCAGVCGALGG